MMSMVEELVKEQGSLPLQDNSCFLEQMLLKGLCHLIKRCAILYVLFCHPKDQYLWQLHDLINNFTNSIPRPNQPICMDFIAMGRPVGQHI